MHGAPRPGPEDEQDPGGLRAAGCGGQSEAALPGKQACLHVFPEHLLCAGPWGHTEKTVDRPMPRGLMADTHGLSQSTQSLLKAVSAVKTTAQSDLRGGCHGQGVKEGLLEEVASGWRPAQCWAVQGPHHCSAAWPCRPSALTPVPEGTGAGVCTVPRGCTSKQIENVPWRSKRCRENHRAGHRGPGERRAREPRVEAAEGIQVGDQPGQRLRAGKDLSPVGVGGEMGSGCRPWRSAKDRGTVGILFSEQQGGFYKRRCHGPSNREDRLCWGPCGWRVGV